jgi:hypothetical protein
VYAAAISNTNSSTVSLAVIKTLLVWANTDNKALDFDRFGAYFLATMQLNINPHVSVELFKLLNALVSANRLTKVAPIISEIDKQFAQLFVDTTNPTQTVEVLKLLAASQRSLGEYS